MAGPTFSVRAVATRGSGDEEPPTPVGPTGDGAGQEAGDGVTGADGSSATDVVIGLGVLCAAVAAIGGG